MYNILIATHGNLAKGLVSSAKIITGKSKKLHTFCAYIEKNVDYEKKLKNLIIKLSGKEDLVVLTDMLGGSVNNIAFGMLDKHNFHLISGVNLPLLLQFIVMQNSEGGIEEIIKNAVNESKQSVSYCNNEFENTNEETLDEF